MNTSTLTLMGLTVIAACSATDDGRPTAPERSSPPTGLIVLDEAESQLEAEFNRNSAKAQLVVVLSPT
ncbi:MAG: hypothetical protein ACI8QZ_002985 [Chlamydiales bacterium]|jgi:hypothetical protein